MQNFISYTFLHNFRKYLLSQIFIFLFISFKVDTFSQNTILQGRDSQKDTIYVNTGDKYFDSGGQGGSRLPDQPGNYFNCTNPFSETSNCTSVFTFCSASNDTVAINFTDYLIVTGDKLRIFSGQNTAGKILFNSQTQGVSINGMRLTTGTLLKSVDPSGCITVEMFATTIGNSIGWEADFITSKKKPFSDPCAPVCFDNVSVALPLDTCFLRLSHNLFVSGNNSSCSNTLQLFYPIGSEDLKSKAVNMSHANKRFLFQVSDSAGSSCVGYLRVNESMAPTVNCDKDTISCQEWELFHSKVTKIQSCNGNGYSITNQKFTAFNCSDDFAGLVTRNLELFDSKGITQTCIDTLYIKKISFDSIQKPEDITFDCNSIKDASLLSPSSLLKSFDKNVDYHFDSTKQLLIPLLDGMPFPDTSAFCGLSASFTDFLIPGCGASFKVRRQWMLKSACLQKDSIIIQYLQIKDNDGPTAKPLSNWNLNLADNECTGKVVINDVSDVADCSVISQKIEFSYPDPSKPGSLIVINNTLPVTLQLPAGAYDLKYSLTDACFNVSTFQNCLWINKSPVLHSTLPSILNLSIDSGNCFKRIYAVDFKSSFSLPCNGTNYLAVAHTDSISYYRNVLTQEIKKSCGGESNFSEKASFYNQIIESWLFTNVYTDHVDINPCDSHKVSLLAVPLDTFLAPNLNFSCSPHKWVAYQLDPLYRIHFNTNKNCSSYFDRMCASDIERLLKSDKAGFEFNNLAHLNDGSCRSVFEKTQLENALTNSLTKEVKIIVIDTLAPISQFLEDIEFIQNYNPSICCKVSNCPGDAFLPNSWPGKVNCTSCDTSNFQRYYGGPINGNVTYSSEGYYTYKMCNEYDSVYNLKPIYCTTALTPYLREFQIDSLFSKVTINAISLQANQLNFNVNCPSSWNITTKDTILASNTCASDTILRKWLITGNCNKTYSISQKLISRRISDFEVLFPPDVQIDCSAKLIKDSVEFQKLFGNPIVKSNSLSCITVSYRDSFISQNKGDYCLYTHRIWKIEDLAHPNSSYSAREYIINDSLVADKLSRYCIYRNLKDGGDGIMYYRQVIKYIDIVPPVFKLKDTTVEGHNCMSPAFNYVLEVHDDCSPDDVLFSDHRLDLNSDGLYDLNYTQQKDSIHFNEGLPTGKHTLMTTSVDLCGNTDTAFHFITITDDGTPLALCVQSSVLIPLPASRSVTILARDFDAGSLAGCEKGPLLFSFSSNLQDTSRTFTCDSIGNKSLSVFITNNSKKFSECNIKLQVTSDNACSDSLQDISITGNVMNSNKSGISKVEIKTNALLMKTTTNSNGSYKLNSLISGQNITLVPFKMDDPLNGLSSIDLLIMERHIKGLSLITDPYRLIAADVNKSASVTITDVVELRKMILGSITNFPNNKDWIFIPEGYKFNDPASPWIYPETVTYNPITSTLSDVNFVGIKVGDLNNSATLSLAELEQRSKNESIFIQVRETREAGKFLYRFYLTREYQNLGALQLHIPLASYSTNNINIQFGQIAAYQSTDLKTLKIIATNPDFISIDPTQTLFTLSSDYQLPLGHSKSPGTLWDKFNIPHTLQLIPYELSNSVKVFPNPSYDLIHLQFYINDLQTSKILLTNLNGKIYDHSRITFHKGWNHILLNKNELYGAGEYFFSVMNSQHVQTIKFILL